MPDITFSLADESKIVLRISEEDALQMREAIFPGETFVDLVEVALQILRDRRGGGE